MFLLRKASILLFLLLSATLYVAVAQEVIFDSHSAEKLPLSDLTYRDYLFLEDRMGQLSDNLSEERKQLSEMADQLLERGLLDPSSIAEARALFDGPTNQYVLRKIELIDPSVENGDMRAREILENSADSIDETIQKIDAIGSLIENDRVSSAILIARNTRLDDTTIVALTSGEQDLTEGVYTEERLFDHFDEFVTSSVGEGYTIDNTEVGMLTKRNRHSGRWEPACSGTLVSANVVITAAHCFCSRPLDTYESCQSFLDDNPNFLNEFEFFVQGGGTRTVTNVLIDEHFQLRVLNDIALLRLNERVENVVPANLETAIEIAALKSEMFVVGFGYSNDGTKDSPELQNLRSEGMKAKGSFITDACLEHPQLPPHELDINERFICWEQSISTIGSSPAGACDGDSGGPIFNEGLLSAVTSFGEACVGKWNYTSRVKNVGNELLNAIRDWTISPSATVKSKVIKSWRRVPHNTSDTWSKNIYFDPNEGDVVVTLNGSMEHDFDLFVKDPSTNQILCTSDTEHPYDFCRVEDPMTSSLVLLVDATEQISKPNTRPLFQISAVQYSVSDSADDQLIVSRER